MFGRLSSQRIGGVVRQELYISRHSLEVWIDILFWPLVTVVLFGFFTMFLASAFHGPSAYYVLLGIILWEIIRIAQYSLTIGPLWNIWSHNLSNMFITPLSVAEYMLARMVTGFVKAVVIFGLISAIAIWVFDFNIYQVGWLNLVGFFVNLALFAWWTGLAVVALVFRYGNRIQALAWSLIFLAQPLSAAFFPVSILPGWLQVVAYSLPSTYVFEAARHALTDPAVNWQFLLVALAENLVYLGLAAWFFRVLYRKSRRTGQFARNDL